MKNIIGNWKKTHSPFSRKKSISITTEAYDGRVITKQEKDFSLIESLAMPYFYFLPKIHKNPSKPPGRPIIAGMDSLTSRLSEYIDRKLQRYAETQGTSLHYYQRSNERMRAPSHP